MLPIGLQAVWCRESRPISVPVARKGPRCLGRAAVKAVSELRERTVGAFWDTTRLHTSANQPNSLQLLHLGAVAQLGEHLPCTQGVVGSNPIRSIPRSFACPLATQRPSTPNRKNHFSGPRYVESHQVTCRDLRDTMPKPIFLSVPTTT